MTRRLLQAFGFEYPFTREQWLFVLWFLFSFAVGCGAASVAGLPELMR